MDKHPVISSDELVVARKSGVHAGYSASKIFVLLCAALLVAVPGAGSAGQLNLTNSPLFLTTPVPSNILFLTDDSGSMAWEFVYNTGTGLDTDDNDPNNIYYFDLTPNTETERLFMCAGYNVLAYDPNVTYGVWQGQDKNGVIFDNAWLYGGGTDASPNYNVRKNPYDPDATGDGFGGTARTTDLTATGIMAYWKWNDSNGDGKFNTGECGDATALSSNTADTSVAKSFDSLSTAEKKNFANWYSYYRKRLLTAKFALSKIIAQAQSEVRMGHATLHNNGGNSNIKIETMNASVTAEPKKALLAALHKAQANGGTPLRTKLNEAGKYYECASDNIFGTSAPSPCPIATNASGGACQQNFTVLMTDGYWNGSSAGVGNTDIDGSGAFDGGAYADSYSDTLADVAMHYYERDLAPGLSNLVPVTAGVNTATHQHMVTYGVAFGVGGTLSAAPPNSTDAFAWPAVSANASTTVDDLRHAAYNGRGQFLTAKNPDSLVTALQNTIGNIGDRTGSSASVAVNSRSLSTSTRLYQARFTSGEWSGDLRALAVNASGDVDTLIWSAKDKLKTQPFDTGTNARVILTRSATIGVPFRWTITGTNALTTALQNNLKDDPATTGTVETSATEGQARLEYLRGSSANEGTGFNFRVRTGGFKLGDIVDSSPIFVGSPPTLPNLETTPHSSFRSAYVSRREMVYVGANDGMLHGFDAATGLEKIAYVPSMVFSNLNKLTDPGYAHRYYVNAAPTAGDAYGTFTNITGECATGCWRTILAGGLGAGGKGIYALDVTDPDGNVTTSGNSTALLAFNENNAAKIALWELPATGANASNMGHVYGQPTIAKVKTGANSTAWAVIFGNGYNSDNENAVLYVVNAVTGAVIRDIPLVAPGYSATKNSNGLSMPAVVDTDGDFVADRVYAGDLRGNLWRVDLTDNNTSNWKSAYGTASNPEPLFKAVDGTTSTTVEQRITVQPEVGKHPDGQSGYMVYFGTGSYIATNDNQASASPIQTFYGIWDRGDVSQVPRSKLLPQTISDATIGSVTVRQVTNDTIQWCTANNTNSCTCDNTASGRCLGWRDNLLTATTGSLGEKSVSNPVLIGGTVPRIIFTTLIPQTDPCSAGGTSALMELNPKNGGRLAEQVFDINGDGTIDSNDMIGGTIPVAGIFPGIGIMPEPTIIRDPANKTDLKAETGSSGAVLTIKNYVSGTQAGRQSWRQLK